MIDFSKKIGDAVVVKQTNPVLLYDTLDRQASAGPLRDVQKNVLTDWFEHHNDDRDVIIKLHTGEGKTLIGLLLLQARLNAGKGPCLYVCPSIQLAEQAALDAQKFGIKHILDMGGDLPLEFTEGRLIFITYVQRVFNGLTRFGLDNDYRRIGTIVLDDSHACIDAIKSAFSIRIKRESMLFQQILSMFEDSLKQQGTGTYMEIRYNDYSSSVLPIPYWDWINKKDEIAKLFYENQEDEAIRYSYPLLKDIWENCTAYVTSSGIEITPDYNLIGRFSSFVYSKQRVLMSATTQDDSFFIKGLGFTKESVIYPLTDNAHIWSGEKMILFPSRVDDSMTTELMRNWICEVAKRRPISIVVLVPSRRIADEYLKCGAQFAYGSNITSEIKYLKGGVYGDHAVVFANRYDGIDLPDNQCRILVIDSLPFFGSLSDRYEQSCREDSQIIATKVAQKIEQGLGRSVRGEKDYSVILLLGEDLVHFIKTSANQTLFSDQTRKQIGLAEVITESVKEEVGTEEPMKALVDVINQCLNRDEGWKAFYQQSMDTIERTEEEHRLIDLIENEYNAELALAQKDYLRAASFYQDLANQLFESSKLEYGWYLQKKAKCEFFISQVNAQKIQKSAHEHNIYLLMPNGVTYSPIGTSNVSYLQNMMDGLHKLGTYDQLQIKVNNILSKLVFGVSAKVFEKAVDDIGRLLGYQCQRPDNTYKVGPDNLWMTPLDRYFFAIECKNEVLQSRDFISKDEVGQMNNHIGWFENNYPLEKKVSYIHIHATNKVSNKANYNADVRIMTPEKLNKFKDNVRRFVCEFAKYDLSTITESTINEALRQHKLCPENVIESYTEQPIVDENN